MIVNCQAVILSIYDSKIPFCTSGVFVDPAKLPGTCQQIIPATLFDKVAM